MIIMEIREKKLEQYLFSRNSIDYIIKITSSFNSLLLISTPSIAQYLYETGDKRDILLLEIDNKFKKIPFFKKYDINSMEKIEKRYELVIFDPPAFRFLPEQLVEFLKLQFTFSQKILLIYPEMFFKKIEEDLLEFKFKKIEKQVEYIEENDFNKREMSFLKNFESSISKS